jgi:hypothetical protein
MEAPRRLRPPYAWQSVPLAPPDVREGAFRRNHPPIAAARGSSSLCCCVLLQGSGGGRGAGRRSEAKTRSNWRSVMTQIATKYVADPHKYGDGSGYGGR